MEIKLKIRGWFIFIVTILLYVGSNLSKVYAYTDSSLYEEKLFFDEEGNLIMTTHDKKATTDIKYQTIGWIIKRYDMPVSAEGQQYVIISMDENVEYKDDTNDNAYMYCYYYGNKEKIANAINSCSTEWKNLLYKYGDYVYIDEIMTVVDNGNILGGLNSNGTSYGEVYYDYGGISEAREWASKENLKTHFDKQVYFPQQITEKYFGYSYTVLSELRRSHTPSYSTQIGQGNKYSSTYNIEDGIPTGSNIYINGYGDRYGYDISFKKVSVNLRLPVKLVIHYTLKWTAYDGSIRTEEKDIISWYYVNRQGSYYVLEDIDIDYLSGVVLDNYALEDGSITKNIYGCNPTVKKIHFTEYYNHIISPDYKDVYYIDGGTISQYEKRGIKPNIPDINRQSVVESFIGQCEVMNDYLSIDNLVVLDNYPAKKEAPEPLNGVYSGKKEIYFTNIKIPHSKINSIDNITTGFLKYKDYNNSNITKYGIAGLKKISIHTPVCISGDVEGSAERFYILVDFTGEHRDIKGYRYNNYSNMCDKVYIKFSEDVYKNGEKILKDSWIELNSKDEYSINKDVEGKDLRATMVAYAKNYIALEDDIGLHIEENANLDMNNYAAKTEFNIVFDEAEINKEAQVVGTH